MMEELSLDIHVILGYIFLFLLLVTFLSRKKSPIHRYSGILFSWTVCISVVAAIVYVLCNGNFFLLPICIQTLLFSVLGLCVAMEVSIRRGGLRFFKGVNALNFLVFICVSFTILMIAGAYDVAITQATFFLFTTYLIDGKNSDMLSSQRYHSVIMVQVTIGVVTAFLLSSVKPKVYFVTPTVIIILNLVSNGLALIHFRQVSASIMGDRRALEQSSHH
jgi:hypothetical protein